MSKKVDKLSKADMSKKVNEVLGLMKTVDFTRLKTEDLEKLHTFISEPSNLLGLFTRAVKTNIGDRSLREILNQPLGNLLGGDRGKGGLLGLGIADRWRDNWNQLMKPRKTQ